MILLKGDGVMSILNLTADSFDEKIAKGKTLVDFWAAWCMPCRMVAPVIDELAADYEGRLTVAKVDVDSENALAARFEILTIPTMILFQDGHEVKRFNGVLSKAEFEKGLDM